MLHGQMPLISVIVPIYKVEQYLKQCVESILSQTYTNLEVILVDDGSPDGCPDMCDDFAKEDSRVIVVHKKNGGLSDARNAGLDIASGEYIGFVDSDDFIAKNMYEILIREAEKNNADIALCNYTRVNCNGEKFNEPALQTHVIDHSYSKLEFIGELCRPYESYYVVAWNKIYRKTIFDQLRFPVGKQHEDEFLIHYLIDASEIITTVKESLYYYRQRQESIMSKGFTVRSLDYGEALIDRYCFAKKRGYREWKKQCAYRLSWALEIWKREGIKGDEEVRRRYKALCRKSRFLIYEPTAWGGPHMSMKGKIFTRVEHLAPTIAQVIRKFSHKEFI